MSPVKYVLYTSPTGLLASPSRKSLLPIQRNSTSSLWTMWSILVRHNIGNELDWKLTRPAPNPYHWTNAHSASLDIHREPLQKKSDAIKYRKRRKDTPDIYVSFGHGLPHWPYAGSVVFWSFADAVLMRHWAEMNTVLSLVSVFLAAVNPAVVWRCCDAMGCFERRASIALVRAARDVSTAVRTRSRAAEVTKWIIYKGIQSKMQAYSTQAGYLIKSSKYFT